MRGVLSMLRRLVADRKPEYFAVVFDAPGKTFRDDWYPQYKAHRPPMPADLAAQIAPLHELIRAHGWPLLMVEGVEADDVIGTLARQADAAGMRCLISSGDKDLTQLVTPQVTVVNTMSNETLDEIGVMTKFGVQAKQMLDYLTLIGDSVDNVPGVPKVGPKTAVKWLAQYGSLEAIVAHAAEIPGVVGENLRASLDWLPQGRRLLAVKTDCDLSTHPADLVPQAAQEALLLPLLQRFEFKTFTQEYSAKSGGPPRPSPPKVTTGEDPPPSVAVTTRQYHTILDEHALGRLVAMLEGADLACFDTETTGLDPLRAEIVGLSFCVAAGVAYYLPLTHDYAGAPRQLELSHTLARLKPWFQNPGKRKLAQNAKFDQHILANHGIAVQGIAHDTLLESYVLESHKPHDMDNLAMRHLGVKTISYAEVCGKGVNQIGFEQVAIDRATEYSAEDADITLQLHEALYPRLAADVKLKAVYETIELPAREVLFIMERNGVLLDSALLMRQSQELGERILALEQRAHALAGQPFNLGSPKQIQEILFNRLGLPVKKKTPTGQPSTDEDVLQELAADYPLPQVLLEHRAFSKLKSTYTDKLPQMVNPRTGRVHTHFAQATAVTGRLASSDPNLQNIPVRTPEGRRIREAFIAPPGCEIVSADYSQIELRIMAHLSGDKNLTQAFAEGADIHRATAAEIFGVPLAEVTPEQRRYTKAINFGLIYGMSAFGLAAQLNIDRTAAQAYIERYFTRYPGVAEYMQRTREMARAQGYVETVFGRRLWIPDINAGGGPRRQGAERAAINAPMQGTAADLVKLAMIRVQHWLEHEGLGSRLLLQVHDELVLEVPHAELRHVQGTLPRLMTEVASLKVPLLVEVGSGPNWDKAH